MKDGNYESDACIICGKIFVVSKKFFHMAILEHCIESHMARHKTDWSNTGLQCWCGIIVMGHDQRSQMRQHLSHFVDIMMVFPESVDQLWAHYHAAILNVNPKEEPCDTSTGTRTK